MRVPLIEELVCVRVCIISSCVLVLCACFVRVCVCRHFLRFNNYSFYSSS